MAAQKPIIWERPWHGENRCEITIMHNFDNQTIELALFALIALAMVVQAFVLLAAFLAMRKAARSVNDKIEEVRSSVMPLIETSRNLFTKLAPKIESATDDVAAIAHSVRTQSAEIQAAASDIMSKAQAQAGRLDAMITNVFDAMDRAGGFVADCINKPMRQLSALLAATKAALESLHTAVPASRSQSNRASGDGDMFI